jgi:DNA-binding transcriptional ArsR family regulator
MDAPNPDAKLIRYADMLAALGAETRLRIVRLLLSAHPHGIVVGEIGAELGVAPSTLSHHLEKLKNEDLVLVRRESTFLRYTANTKVLEEVLAFLYSECCTRNKAINPDAITCCSPVRTFDAPSRPGAKPRNAAPPHKSAKPQNFAKGESK